MNFPTQKLFLYFIPVIIIIGSFVFWRNTVADKNEVASLSVIANESSLIESDIETDEKFANWQSALGEQSKITSATRSTISSSKNKTEALGGELFSEYVSLKQSGQINNESINQLATRISQDVASIENGPLYSSVDIVTTNDASEDALRMYANTVATVREKYKTEFVKQIGDATFVSPSDKNFQSSMTLAAQLYSSQAKELLKIKAPKTVSSIHLRLINSYAGSSAGLEKMKLLDTDPTMSALGMKQFDADSKNESVILQELRLHLTSNGILISPNDIAFSLWN